MIEKIMGFIWPPYGWHLRKCAIDAEDAMYRAIWVKDVYIPSMKRQANVSLKEFNRPMFLCRFITHS